MPRTPSNTFSEQSVTIAQDDLAVLELLTNDQIQGIGTHAHSAIESPDDALAVESNTTNTIKKDTRFKRRDADFDPLLFVAAVASGPHVTRHHYHHNFNPLDEDYFWNWEKREGYVNGSDEDDENVRPKYISKQAPRSERVRLLRERQQVHNERTPSLSPDFGPSETSGSSASQSDESDDEKSIPSLSLSTPQTSSSSLSSSPALSSTQLRPDSLLPATTFPRSNVSSDVQVKCMARTRVPTPHGEVFLHLNHNNRDNKEHLAVVFDPAQLAHDGGSANSNDVQASFIRSRTLDAVWSETETPMDRIIRGAYVGRLNEERCVASKPQDDTTEATQSTDSENDFSALIPPPLVRIHSECYTGETIGSMRCDCGEQLDESIRRISEPLTIHVPASESRAGFTKTIPGRGAVIYMRQEGRGIGLLSKLRAYNLQDLGHDTVAANLMLGFGADERGYDVAAAIMKDLGLDSGVRLLTNNPEKVQSMEKEGILVKDRVEMVPRTWRWKCQGESASDFGLSRLHLHSDPNSSYDISARDSAEEEHSARLRASGATLIGASATHGPELEKYLRTKVLKMGHMLSLPTS